MERGIRDNREYAFGLLRVLILRGMQLLCLQLQAAYNRAFLLAVVFWELIDLQLDLFHLHKWSLFLHTLSTAYQFRKALTP